MMQPWTNGELEVEMKLLTRIGERSCRGVKCMQNGAFHMPLLLMSRTPELRSRRSGFVAGCWGRAEPVRIDSIIQLRSALEIASREF